VIGVSTHDLALVVDGSGVVSRQTRGVNRREQTASLRKKA